MCIAQGVGDGVLAVWPQYCGGLGEPLSCAVGYVYVCLFFSQFLFFIVTLQTLTFVG